MEKNHFSIREHVGSAGATMRIDKVCGCPNSVMSCGLGERSRQQPRRGSDRIGYGAYSRKDKSRKLDNGATLGQILEQRAPEDQTPPDQLPIVLQVLLSEQHRLRASRGE